METSDHCRRTDSDYSAVCLIDQEDKRDFLSLFLSVCEVDALMMILIHSDEVIWKLSHASQHFEAFHSSEDWTVTKRWLRKQIYPSGWFGLWTDMFIVLQCSESLCWLQQ